MRWRPKVQARETMSISSLRSCQLNFKIVEAHVDTSWLELRWARLSPVRNSSQSDSATFHSSQFCASCFNQQCLSPRLTTYILAVSVYRVCPLIPASSVHGNHASPLHVVQGAERSSHTGAAPSKGNIKSWPGCLMMSKLFHVLVTCLCKLDCLEVLHRFCSMILDLKSRPVKNAHLVLV